MAGRLVPTLTHLTPRIHQRSPGAQATNTRSQSRTGVLAKNGVEVRHFLLHSDSYTLRSRIEGSMEFPDDEERSEKVRVFRRRRLAGYETAYATWLGEQAEVIDTVGLTPEQVLTRALTLLGP